MHFIALFIIGLIAGAVAKFLMPGRDPGGCLITMVLGIAGSLAAGVIGRHFGYYQYGETPGFVAAVLGAILILFIYRVVGGRRRRI